MSGTSASPQLAPAPQAAALVAVAASAGGVEALKRLVAAFPTDLPATFLVALHLPEASRSLLAQILARHSPLTVRVAEHGMPLVAGEVLAAPPDHHLLVRSGRVVLGRGPRENGHRPSHDAMLRAVALEAGPRAVGVVLTGLLDDGAAGLAAVARYGGRCFVQDPDDAEFPSMPLAALGTVPDAVRAPLAALATGLAAALAEPAGAAPGVDPDRRHLDEAEVRSAEHGSPGLGDGRPPGTPSSFACPDCSGVLNEVPDAAVLRFRCRTGHAWTALSLAETQDGNVETALWVALRVLEERADLNRRLAEEAREGERSWSADRFGRRADEADRSVQTIKGVLEATIGERERDDGLDPLIEPEPEPVSGTAQGLEPVPGTAPGLQPVPRTAPGLQPASGGVARPVREP